jgi:hypothetical protein
MSVGSSPDLYNILNTILSDVAPHSMSELYSISFTDGTSSVSSGTISLLSFVNKTIGSSGGGGSSAITLAFHHGTFTASDYSSAYSTVAAATTAGHVYSNSPSGTYTWGTLGLPSSTSTNTTYTWTPTAALTGKLLMVAGGGGGGGTIGGGGGAGGVVYSASASISATQQTIVVGNGGTGGWGWDYFPRVGSSGTNTSFTGFTTAIGGGGGSGHGNTSSDGPKTGGSGGGGAQAGTTGASGTAGQGYNGGNSHNGADYAGGGGGAGGIGGTSGGSTGGIGGIGVDYSSEFTTTYGDSGWFASGGGGGVRDGNSRAGGSASIGGGGNGNNLDSSVYTAAQKHTGGGGGGGGFAGGGNFMAGGQGGSGIVIFSNESSPILTPLNIGIDGLTGWYDANSFNTSTQTWVDLSGNGNDANRTRGTVYKNETGLNGRPIIYGGTGDGGIEFPSAAMGGAPTTYTIFTVAKYGSDQNTSGTRGRIFNGWNNSDQGNNWLTGFWNGVAGVAYHGTFITETSDIHGYNWVLGTSQHSMYRSNGTDRTKSNTAGVDGPSYFFINSAIESTTWSVAEVIFYKGTNLTPEEYTKVEEYLNGKYNITTNVGKSGGTPIEYPTSALSSAANSGETIAGITYTTTASSNQYGEIWKAFDKTTPGHSTFWHSNENVYNSTSGAYTGSNSLGGVSGEWIKLQLSTGIAPTSVNITGRTTYDNQAPNSWEILGSTNNSSWTSLLSSTVHATYNGGSGHTVSISGASVYTYLALVVKAKGGTGQSAVVISELRYFGTTTTGGSSSGSNIVISTNVTSIYSSKITSFSSSSVTVSSVSGIAQGDWVMIHQTYYPTGNSNLSSVCPYEFKEISSISGSTLTFTTSITGVFIDGAQVIKAYRCNDFTLNSGISITTSAWNVNTYTGGIIPIYADGAVTINGTINMEGKGYQGREKTKSGSTFENGLNGRGIDNSDRGAGIGGLKGAGGSGNAGGGGGGGHENNGSIGNGSGSNSGNVSGGSAFGSTSGNYLTMGGSGGQGAPHDIAGAYQRGGHGGGAVFIQGTDITGSGTINVNGTSGHDNVGVIRWQGGAGGGAGGMVLFKTSSGTASFTNVTKNGGAGLSGTNGSSVAHSGYNGGNGSTGRFVNV